MGVRYSNTSSPPRAQPQKWQHSQTIKSLSGSFELTKPRDRAGSFEPQLIKKNRTYLTDELDRKILSMFAHGMSYQAIREHVKEMYGMDPSNRTLNAMGIGHWFEQAGFTINSPVTIRVM